MAATTSLVVVVDVDALCNELDGRISRELVDTLRMLASSDAQILLISARAPELAAALHVDLEGTWWCDRSLGWHDGVRGRDTQTSISFALVLSQLRTRMPNARVLALSNDPSLWAALDSNDRIIVFGDTMHEAPYGISIVTDQLIDTIWCVIDMRTHYRRLAR